MHLPVPSEFASKLQRDVSARPVVTFRRVFAAVWLVYDVCDLWLSGTALCAWWATTTLQGAPQGLQLLQLGLIGTQLLWLRGRFVIPAGIAAIALRSAEQVMYFGLNDFLYYIITAAWLTFAAAYEFTPSAATQVADGGQSPRLPEWLHDGLVIQTGFIYVASAVMKMNPAFLSGEHFWVRHAYMATVLNWPYPAFLEGWLLSPRIDQALAWLTVGSEAALGVLLCLRRARPLALVLAFGIHVFAALAVNVIFFGASLLAQVWLLFPPRRASGGVP